MLCRMYISIWLFVYRSIDLKRSKNKDFDGCDHRDHQERSQLPKDDEELMHNLKWKIN